MDIIVFTASKPPAFAINWPLNIQVSQDGTIADVKAVISTKYPKFSVSRQKISLKNDRKLLADDVKLRELGEKAIELQVKDLGPQIGWRTVFFVEYVGPLFIHPLFYYFPKFWYGQDVVHSSLQKYVYVFVMLHFIKRELETFFVHRFSAGTMPFFNIFLNSSHYHILGGLFLAFDIYHPKFSLNSPYIIDTYHDDKDFLYVAAGLWAFAELSNFHTHMTLRSLRPPGTRTRAIPHGYGFSFVSCPNYFFEILAWSVIAVITNSIAAWIFLVVAIFVMSIWAIKKHRNYKKEFGKDYPKRQAIFPFVL
ncbi:Very-long-chain enoyl-CoA reductase [Leucoagaricus gongylophorus]